MPTVADLFDVKLGVRPGNKPVFLIPESELLAAGVSAEERSFFRPVCDEIRNAHVVHRDVLFYPYLFGKLLLRDENELAAKVPWFYANRLLPNREELEARSSLRGREWWEMSEPRPTWMDSNNPRIVSPAFGYFGSFAMDPGPPFIVLQGSAWIWKKNENDRDILLAYLALLNSYEFESLLELLCPKVGGGQYQLYTADVSGVPLPDLSIAPQKLRDGLTAIGRSVASGDGLDPLMVSELAANSYGMSSKEFRETFSPGEIGELQEVFDSLSERWRVESEHLSKVSTMEQLPSYKAIVELGRNAVPMLIRTLRQRPDFWFGALSKITSADPVDKEHRGHIQQMQDDWMNWARANRQW